MTPEPMYCNEYTLRDAPETDADALELLPQIPAAHGLCKCHRALGLGVLEAMK